VLAPDFIEPVIGWRVWRVRKERTGLRLFSTLFEERWEPEHPLTAFCAAEGSELPLHRFVLPAEERDHRAPSEACSCGIHAASAITKAATYLVGRNDPLVIHRVIGQVALWGQVVEAEHGWRGSLAYPSRLWIPLQLPSGRPAAASSIALALADYGVPVELVDAATPAAVAVKVRAA
jgi:hypothetical protein